MKGKYWSCERVSYMNKVGGWTSVWAKVTDLHPRSNMDHGQSLLDLLAMCTYKTDANSHFSPVIKTMKRR